jgi:hypothetical protein
MVQNVSLGGRRNRPGHKHGQGFDFTSLPAHVKHPMDVPTFVNDARSIGLTQIECLVMNKKRRSHDAFVARNRPNFNKAARRFSIRVVVGSLPQLRAAM